MAIEKLKELSFEEMRELYKDHLIRMKYAQSTINTSSSEAFYLWRKCSKELFWNTVASSNFEDEARSVVISTLRRESIGNVDALVNNYMWHLRKFRVYLYGTDSKKAVQSKPVGKKHSKNGCREVIVNKMYVGKFLLQGDNIGHEIINLYKADDGKNYIYLNSQGAIFEVHKKYEITVLLVRSFARRTYKVLAKAEGIRILDFAVNENSREEKRRGQEELGLTYGGVKLTDLFDNNIYGRGLEDNKNLYTTFEADRVIKPKEPIFITDDTSISGANMFYIRTNKGFGNTTLREFFDEEEKKESFTDFYQIISNNELWEESNTTQTISELTLTSGDSYFNFLNIIKQEDNEIVFSNMLAYFFNLNKKVFSRFCKEVLSVNINNEYIIEREKKNIDLLISDDNNVIVVENKIKSSINGISERHNIYSDRVQSQLNKYFDFVTTDENYSNKVAKCFIFAPNYNRIDLSKFAQGEKYTVIYYREIYEFFVKYSEFFNGIDYFEDFVKSMYKHTKDYDDELEIEMQRRFQNALEKAKKTSNLL